jgi:hypothetical protein
MKKRDLTPMLIEDVMIGHEFCLNLKGACWYDAKHVNQQGALLFPLKDVEYDSYAKYSIICTWVDDYPNSSLGQLSPIKIIAIEKL